MSELPELPPVVTKMGYKLVKHVGSGGFAQVYKCTCSRKDMADKELAVKVIDFSKVDKIWIEKNLNNEMIISKILKHPNVIRVYDLFKTTSSAYIFMDFAKNGSIDNILQKTKKPLSESKTKKYMEDIVNGLVYIHSRGIAHRDLKPDNFLIDSDDNIWISDFGFACIGLNKNSEKVLKATSCGTPEYMSIELKLLREGEVYDAKPTDLYSLGVSLYEMVLFDYPFDTKNKIECIRKQKARDFQMESKFSPISESLKKLIYSLLDPNPKTRPTAREVQRCKWITNV